MYNFIHTNNEGKWKFASAVGYIILYICKLDTNPQYTYVR